MINKDIETAWNCQTEIIGQTTGNWNPITEQWSIPMDAIVTPLIQSTGRYCEQHAVDLLTTLKTVNDALLSKEIEPTIILFGIRKLGVDSNEFVLIRLKEHKHIAGYSEMYYRQIFALQIEEDKSDNTLENTMIITLKDVTIQLDYTDSIEVPDELGIVYKKPSNIWQTKILSTYHVKFTDETAFGEPVAWIYLSDNTSLEICHEEHELSLTNQFYSIRRYCSDEDYNNNNYHATCGVKSHKTANSIDSLKTILSEILTELADNGITIITKQPVCSTAEC